MKHPAKLFNILALPQQLSLNLTISLLLKNTIDLLFFSEHKLFGFSQSDIYTLLKKPTGIFRFVTLPIENKLSPLRILQNCVTPFWWKIQGQKPKRMEIPHEFFVSAPGNSTSFLTICLPGDTGVPELQYSSLNSALAF